MQFAASYPERHPVSYLALLLVTLTAHPHHRLRFQRIVFLRGRPASHWQYFRDRG